MFILTYSTDRHIDDMHLIYDLNLPAVNKMVDSFKIKLITVLRYYVNYFDVTIARLFQYLFFCQFIIFDQKILILSIFQECIRFISCIQLDTILCDFV